MAEQDANEIYERKEMLKNLNQLVKLQEDQQKEQREFKNDFKNFKEKEFKQQCDGIECLKQDLAKFQHSHDNKFSGLEKNIKDGMENRFTGLEKNIKEEEKSFDTKFSKLESEFEKEYIPKLKTQCEGLDCLKENLKELNTKLDSRLDPLTLSPCPRGDCSGQLQIGSRFCPDCGADLQKEGFAWTDNKGAELPWKPRWDSLKKK